MFCGTPGGCSLHHPPRCIDACLGRGVPWCFRVSSHEELYTSPVIAFSEKAYELPGEKSNDLSRTANKYRNTMISVRRITVEEPCHSRNIFANEGKSYLCRSTCCCSASNLLKEAQPQVDINRYHSSRFTRIPHSSCCTYSRLVTGMLIGISSRSISQSFFVGVEGVKLPQ